MFFNQSFEVSDLAKVAVLVVLEAVLSIDNALVLGLLAKRLPKSQRAKALTFGLVGAFGFRLISIVVAQKLLTYTIFKLLGGGYLFYVSVKYFWDELFGQTQEGNFESSSAEELAHQGSPAAESQVAAMDEASSPGVSSAGPPQQPIPLPKSQPPSRATAGFWSTIVVIELTDIAFAVDSIVAAIGLVGPAKEGQWHPKLWVVVLGGMMGVVLMRYAATVFIRLLEMFPRFETAAYLLVAIIGSKLTLDWFFNTKDHPHRLDFHSPTAPAFWIFWLVMLASFCIGFIPKKTPPKSDSASLFRS